MKNIAAENALKETGDALAALAGSLLEDSKDDANIASIRREVIRIMRIKNGHVELPPLYLAATVPSGQTDIVARSENGDAFYMSVPEGPDQEGWIASALEALNHARVVAERQQVVMAASPKRQG